MIGRKSMRKVSPIILVMMAFGLGFATYSILTMLIQNKAMSSEKSNGSEWFDPRSETRTDGNVKFHVAPRSERRMDGKTGSSNVKFHVALTATNTTYSKWQSRIMYYWYKKMKDMPGSDMGAFTRILHSGKPDNLMEEIPTVVVDPLPQGLDRGYIVLNRPWAFVQWLEKETIDEEYILMAEPDHIFANPLPNLAHGDPVAFPFFYIKPVEHENILRKFYPEEMGPMTNVDPIGNSPVIIKKLILEKIAPTWMDVSMRMKDDPETDKTFGWVLEMYAYAIASALHGVRHILRRDFMIQPPWDYFVGKEFIIHYTYGCDYTMKGILTYGTTGEWSFDKRTYAKDPPPRNLTLPPRGVPESVVQLVNMVNEASANIPGW